MENVKKETTQPVFDKELQQIFGSHYTDATAAAPVKKVKPAPAKKAPAQETESGPDAEAIPSWAPVKAAPDWQDRLKNAAKWSLTFGALSLLIFYWQQTGLMDPAAAVPSLYACALLAGWGVGKNAKK
jgi:hypothetical protein